MGWILFFFKGLFKLFGFFWVIDIKLVSKRNYKEILGII